MNVKHTDDDPIYFDHYDAEALNDILDTQQKIIEFPKQKMNIFLSTKLKKKKNNDLVRAIKKEKRREKPVFTTI